MTMQLTRTPQPTRADIDARPGLGEPTPRVLLKPTAPKTGYVDGAWWPYTGDLVTELPGLITILAARLGSVLRVEYYLIDWDTPTGPLTVAGQPVRLDWHGYTPAHTVELTGTPHHRRLVLLVVPPETALSDACSAMASAAAANSNPTVDGLLRLGIRRRRERAGRKFAALHWADRTTSPN
ncbi:DUF5994 family protein [Nocardia sp. NPDC059091]|uniref:DUF5994 family protein n=1 Tax=unclassified Nocardia TaxID=2637762 RepID=UPI003688EE07